MCLLQPIHSNQTGSLRKLEDMSTRVLSPAAETTAERQWFREQYRSRLWRADLLTVVSWVSVALALALFLADGGARKFSTIGGAFTATGIISGLVGTDLVFIMLLLAARLPFIDHTIGHDKAMAFHKKLGKPSLYLLLGHGLFLLIGYGIDSGMNPLAEAVDLWNNAEDMPLAYLSMLLFIAVVVTSLVAVRRKFPYEFWHVIHLLSYAAVLTALPHQFSVGSMFAEGTWQRWYWIALYVATLGALLVYRVAMPLVLTARHSLQVSRITREAPGVINIEMTGRDIHLLKAEGGQFFVWRFWAPGLWWHAHPFSLSAAPGGNSLRITVRDLGKGSGRLMRLKPGTKVSIQGPYGLFTERARTSNKITMIAAGIGITPVRSLLERSYFAPGEASVILRASTDNELYLYDEIYDLCVQRGARLYLARGPRARGVQSWLPAKALQSGYDLRSYAPDITESDVYICGPRPWAELVLRDVKLAGVHEDQIHYERFDW